MLKLAGIEPDGFVAPAYAYTPALRSVLPSYRPAESFMLFAADKCAPGAYNLPLYLAFCDPMHNGGLLLNPRLHEGFTLTIMDMDALEEIAFS